MPPYTLGLMLVLVNLRNYLVKGASFSRYLSSATLQRANLLRSPFVDRSNCSLLQKRKIISGVNAAFVETPRNSFGGDNTLWRTGPTISHANAVLNNHLQQVYGVRNDCLVEVEMGRLFEQDKRRYAGGNFVEDDTESSTTTNDVGGTKDGEYANSVTNVGETKLSLTSENGEDGDGVIGGNVPKDDLIHIRSASKKKKIQPVHLTMLRKDAIRSLMQNNSTAMTGADVESSRSGRRFNYGWMHEPNPLLKTMHPNLSNYFDFVIRAEDVGVSKPDARVYKARAGGGVNVIAKWERGMISEKEAVEAFSEAVGPWWVHIGDDFFKDVVASKVFQMRSVWVRELIAKKETRIETKPQRERTVEELENEIAKQKGVLRMSIGESEFLKTSLHEEFSDAILDRFDELSDLRPVA
eukprot:CCRYP_014989-RA/>CCRYP_014989-RA protein AED:0.24 eAED:0.24 QI:136/0/0.25/1/0.66/0.75/4/0/410